MQDIFYFVNLLMHDLVGVFAGGRSDIKIYLFLAFVVLVGILALSRLSFLKNIKISGKVVIVTISATFIYNLGLLIAFFYRFGFSVSDFVVVFHNNEVSSTTLLHNHVGKGFNGLLLQLFNNGQQENIDTGLAFVGLLPSLLLWVGGLLMLVCAVMLLIRFLQNLELNPKWKVLQVIAFSILAFSLLKNMLDGGILNRETPVALAGLLMLDIISRQSQGGSKEKNRTLILISILVVPIYFVLSTLLAWVNIVDMNFWLNTIFATLAFSSLTITLVYWLKEKQKTRLGILLVVLTLTFLYVPASQAWNAYNNATEKISDSGTYVGLYSEPVGPGKWDKIDTINKLNLYHYTPKTADETAAELLKNNNLLGNLNPVTLPWHFCIPTAKSQKIDFNFTTVGTLQPMKIDYKFIQLTNSELISEHRNLKTYAIRIALDECGPRSLNQIEEAFKAQGFNSFFITKLRSADESLYGGVE